MSCRYYLFPINNIYASVLYACYLFSRQIIYLFSLLWAYCNVIDSCCREIIRLRGKYRTTSEAINKSAITAIILLILRSFQRKGLCNSGLKAKSTTFAYNKKSIISNFLDTFWYLYLVCPCQSPKRSITYVLNTTRYFYTIKRTTINNS